MRYVRARKPGTLDPAKYDELEGMLQDISPAVRAQPGCQSYLGATDRAAGKTVSVSTWDTEEHAKFPRDALGGIASRLQAIGLQLDPPEIYESSQ
ncbi:MAG: antibiotic biosynthesis monooxygenase [Candidatus Dormibacteraeota bacterium]|nr:antibiotic biosynthesis monooxygenase [Candidatus Dormibacteraeota bacterium]